MSTVHRRDRVNATTPMRCPICDGELANVMIRDLGAITLEQIWQVHAGQCAEHGWFQTEIVSRPPREIFSVDRPFGSARRVLIDGREQFSFPTIWLDQSDEVKRSRVDALDARYWRPRRLVKTAGGR
jgi:hypothetical protein